MLKQRERKRGRSNWDGERRTEVPFSRLGGVKVTLEMRIRDLLVTSSNQENSSALRCTIRMISPCFKINRGTVLTNFRMILMKRLPGKIPKLDLLMGDLKSCWVWFINLFAFHVLQNWLKNWSLVWSTFCRSDIKSPQDKWQVEPPDYDGEGNYPAVTTLDSRSSSIIAPVDFQEDYDGRELLHFKLEKAASRRSDVSSRHSDLDRMSSIEEDQGPLLQSPRGSSRSGSIHRATPTIDNNGETLLADPFQVRRVSSGRLSDQLSHFSSTDV